MKVFISWSGDRSHKVAEVFNEYLPLMIQEVKPYLSSEDIEKGTRWSSNIAGQLEETNFGIICITKENIESPWLNFEAGALSKSIDNAKVCPFLFGLQASDLSGTPLTQFQITTNKKDDFLKMIDSLNNSLGDDKLDNERLQKIFGTYWNEIEEKFSEIESVKVKSSDNKKKDNNAFEEILKLLNNQNIILNNPEKLLPREYIEYILNRANTGRHIRDSYVIPFRRSELKEISRRIVVIKDEFPLYNKISYSSILFLLNCLLDSLVCNISYLKSENYMKVGSVSIGDYRDLRDLIKTTIDTMVRNEKEIIFE